MITFYYNLAVNPMKVALFLEESGLEHRPVPVDTRKGEQHQAGFRALNPNGKVPVIDDDGVVVFDSNAILLYLAEKTGRFLPSPDPAARGELLSWLMFVATGVGPFSGQAMHFHRYAPDRIPYALDRYLYEAERHYTVLDRRLETHRHVLGDDYTIIDMALWGWTRRMPAFLGEEVWQRLPALKRWFDEVDGRPAAARAAAIGERHAFKIETDAEAVRHLFGHMAEGNPAR